MPGTGSMNPYLYLNKGGVQGNSGGQDWMEFLSKLGSGGGLFGLGDVATGGMFSAGSSLLGGLAGLLRGESKAEKRGNEVYNIAKNQMGQDVLDPDQYLAEYYRAIAPELNMIAEGANKRLGLDSGAAQGALAGQRQSLISRFYLDTLQQNAQLKSMRDQNLLALMAQFAEA